MLFWVWLFLADSWKEAERQLLSGAFRSVGPIQEDSGGDSAGSRGTDECPQTGSFIGGSLEEGCHLFLEGQEVTLRSASSGRA